MGDFGAPLTHTEILLPLGEKHILSPKPPDGISEIIEFPRLEVSDQRELSSGGGTPLCHSLLWAVRLGDLTAGEILAAQSSLWGMLLIRVCLDTHISCHSSNL